MEENDLELLTFGYKFAQRQVICRKCGFPQAKKEIVFVMRDGHYRGRDIFLCTNCVKDLRKALSIRKSLDTLLK